MAGSLSGGLGGVFSDNSGIQLHVLLKLKFVTLSKELVMLAEDGDGEGGIF